MKLVTKNEDVGIRVLARVEFHPLKHLLETAPENITFHIFWKTNITKRKNIIQSDFLSSACYTRETCGLCDSVNYL